MLLAACNAPQPSGGATSTPRATPTIRRDEQVTISFAVRDYERPVYQPLADRFMADHPGIKVVLVSLDEALLDESGSDASTDSIETLRRVVSAADTASASMLTPEAFGTPLLLDLKPLMDADASFQRDDFFPGAIERYAAKGGVWALPRFYEVVPLIIYNRTLFQNANLPEPRPGWTRDDLLAAAERLTESDSLMNRTCGFIDPSDGFLPFLALLEKQGINPLTALPEKTDLTSPAYVAALERIQEWYRTCVLALRYYSDPANDPTLLVREGRMALWSDGIYIGDDDGEDWTPDFPVGYAPFPASVLTPFYSSTEGFIISGGTAHPEAAWRWIEWLSRQPVAADLSVIPARQSVAQQTEFWSRLDPQIAEAYRWSIANSGTLPDSQFDHTVLDALSHALSTVVFAFGDSKKSARQALAEAQRLMQESMTQQDVTPTPKPYIGPVVVATPEPQEAPPGAVTVTFGSPESPFICRLVRAFREQRPGIFVQLKEVNWSSGAQDMSAATLAQAYDCFLWSGPLSGDDETALLDLRPLMDADPAFPRDDVPPAVLAYYTRGGRLYGLPYTVKVRSLIYNRALFETAGVQPPRADWTPNDFLAAAQALPRGTEQAPRWGYLPLGRARADLLFFISQFGARLMVGEGKDLRPNFTDPKTIAAIRWYLDLSMVHKVAPPPDFAYWRRGLADSPYYELVQSGRVGMSLGDADMFLGGVVFQQPGAPPVERDIRAAPLPVGGAGVPPGELSVTGLFISARAQQPQACWEWIAFFSGRLPASVPDAMPARRSVAQSQAFTSQLAPWKAEQFATMRATLEMPSKNLADPDIIYSRYSDPYWFFKALTAVVEEGANLEEELARAQRLTTAYIECLNQSGGKPAACAKQVDPEYRGSNVED